MTDQDFERKEKARLDAMYDAQFADEPTSDVDYADEPQVNGWPLYSGLPQPMKPTQEQVLQWAREVWGDNSGKPWHESALVHLEAFATLVYKAGCKDENENAAKEADKWIGCDGLAAAIRARREQ